MDTPLVTVDGIAAGGEGIGRLHGKTIFIRLAAPGDTVRCRIIAEHKTWARAELEELLEPSPQRTAPPCPHYGECGGCDLQHLTYEAQIAAKTAILKDAFVRIGGITPPEPEVFTSAPWEYRNRMKFHVQGAASRDQGAANREQAYGLKARHSDDIVPIGDCPVADPGIRAFLRQSHAGDIPAFCQAKKSFSVYARGGLFLVEGGVEQGITKILDRDMHMDATVFFQGNAAMLETLISDLSVVARNADRSAAMADLYCGVGTFAAFLGSGFHRIDLLEENPKALALARKNVMRGESGGDFPDFSARRHGVHGGTEGLRNRGAESIKFFSMRDRDWPSLNRTGYGFIVADPPRQGLDPGLAAWIAANGPPLFAYVSCNPATLARDSKTLCQNRYSLSSLRFYDFYPQTAHIECLAVFSAR